MDLTTFQSHINFEVLAKLFFDITDERYPSSEKVRQLVERIVNTIEADLLERTYTQIAILNAMRI